MAGDPLFDGRGCLTPSGRDALRNAPVGAAPPELALHLASCARCQQDMLATETAGHARGGSASPRPRPTRTVYLLLAVLLAGAALLLSTYWVVRSRLSP
jgi:hypothetical protein